MSVTVSPTALLKGLRIRLLNSVKTETPVWVNAICMVENSDSDLEDYEWLGQPPTMEEFEGRKKTTDLTDTSFQIVNREFDGTLQFKKTDLKDNKTGSFRRRISQLASRASAHPNKIVIEAVEAGTTDLGYDGVSLFNNAHPARKNEGGTQDNLLAGTGTTTAALQTDLNVAMTQQNTVLDEAGEPFHGDGPIDMLVVCHPTLRLNFSEVLEATQISNTTNVQRGIARLMTSPRLTDVDDWYLFTVDADVRPFIWQTRDPLEMVTLETGSDQAFWEKIHAFGVEARYAVGNAFWQSATKTVN